MTQYNDNQFLTSADHQDAAAAVVDLQTEVQRRTESTELRLAPRLRLTRYVGGAADLESANDAFIDVQASSERERWNWSLIGDLDVESTVTSELQETGLVQADRYRHSRHARGLMNYLKSERAGYSVGSFVKRVDYTDKRATPLVGYDYAGADLSYFRDFSAVTRLTTTLALTHLDSPRAGSDSRTISYALSFASRINERLRLTGSAEWRGSRFMAERDDVVEGFAGQFQAEYRPERDSWITSLGRSLQPYGNGELVEESRAAVSFRHNSDDYRSLLASLTVLTSEDLQGLSAVNDRRYGWAELRYEQRMSQTWRLACGYRHTRQRYREDNAWSRANLAFFEMRYEAQPDQLH